MIIYLIDRELGKLRFHFPTYVKTSWIKLNCNGVYKNVADLVGSGDLLHNSHGCWIQGYTQKIECCDILHADMWGMYTCMEVALKKD
jgi:hypothetical protein